MLLLPFCFHVHNSFLRLNCAEIVDSTLSAKHLMTHNTQNNNNIFFQTKYIAKNLVENYKAKETNSGQIPASTY